jgi:hypothetical protein
LSFFSRPGGQSLRPLVEGDAPIVEADEPVPPDAEALGRVVPSILMLVVLELVAVLPAVLPLPLVAPLLAVLPLGDVLVPAAVVPLAAVLGVVDVAPAVVSFRSRRWRVVVVSPDLAPAVLPLMPVVVVNEPLVLAAAPA